MMLGIWARYGCNTVCGCGRLLSSGGRPYSVALSQTGSLWTSKLSLSSSAIYSSRLTDSTQAGKLILSTAAPLLLIQRRSAAGGQRSDRARLLGRLALIWCGTALVIAVILAVDWTTHAKNVGHRESQRKQERAGEKPSVRSYFFSLPCMRNSILLGFLGGISSWVATFLFTSNTKKAYSMLLRTPGVIGGAYLIICMIQSAENRAEAKKLNDVLTDIQNRKQGGESDEGETSNPEEKIDEL